MLKSENETNRQLKWLDQTLANSKAPWKIVGLSRPALTAATRNLSKTERALADKLTPLLQKHAVHLVAWSGGRWYERLQMTPQTLAINTGWSGGAKQTRFELIPQLKAAYSLRGGYVVITFGESTASLQAFDSQGALVDEATLNNGLTTQ